MVEDAFDDQCTGANPRYPLMKELKEMYLRAYYGVEKFNEISNLKVSKEKTKEKASEKKAQ